jgi:hypothetical protein
MVEKEIDETEQMGRSGKQNEEGVKLRKVEDGIGNVGGGRGRWMTGLRNV